MGDQCYLLSFYRGQSHDAVSACDGKPWLRPTGFDSTNKQLDNLADFMKANGVSGGLWVGLNEKEPLQTWYWQSTLKFDGNCQMCILMVV